MSQSQQFIVAFNETQAKVILSIIDVGCARGAWRGSDLASIGQMYDYINAHLQQSKKPQVQQVPGVQAQASDSLASSASTSGDIVVAAPE